MNASDSTQGPQAGLEFSLAQVTRWVRQPQRTIAPFERVRQPFIDIQEHVACNIPPHLLLNKRYHQEDARLFGSHLSLLYHHRVGGDFFVSMGMDSAQSGLRFRTVIGGTNSPHTYVGLKCLHTAIGLFDPELWGKWQSWVDDNHDTNADYRDLIEMLMGRPSYDLSQVLIRLSADLETKSIFRQHDDTDGNSFGFMKLIFSNGQVSLMTEEVIGGQSTINEYHEMIAYLQQTRPFVNMPVIMAEPDWANEKFRPEVALWNALHILAVAMLIDESVRPQRDVLLRPDCWRG